MRTSPPPRSQISDKLTKMSILIWWNAFCLFACCFFLFSPFKLERLLFVCRVFLVCDHRQIAQPIRMHFSIFWHLNHILVHFWHSLFVILTYLLDRKHPSGKSWTEWHSVSMRSSIASTALKLKQTLGCLSLFLSLAFAWCDAWTFVLELISIIHDLAVCVCRSRWPNINIVLSFQVETVIQSHTHTHTQP